MRIISLGCSLLLTGLILLSGCASHRVAMPTMDLPLEPVKPKIASQVIMQGDKAYVAYAVADSLKLYEFLLRKDSYEEKLRYRIDNMNKLMVK